MWWCLSHSEPMVKKEYCSVELTDAKYKAFVYAIDNHYWYQMYIGKCLHVHHSDCSWICSYCTIIYSSVYVV